MFSRLQASWSCAALCLFSSGATAADWYVDIGNVDCASADGSPGAPFCLISDAIAIAQDGDTIHIAAGTYPENLVLEKELTLIGTEGPLATIVDGMRIARTLLVEGGATARVHGLTLTGGFGVPGAGVLVSTGASLVLTESVVRANGSATDLDGDGGGLAVAESAVAHLLDCTVEENGAVVDGGGLSVVSSATLTLTRCLVRANMTGFDNFGGRGAAIYNEGGAVSIVGSVISDNFATRFGDAAQGGGIYSSGGSLSISDSAVIRNVVISFFSSATGGGVHCATAGTMFEDSLLADNVARSVKSEGLGGGAFFASDATLVLSSVAGNVALRGGGVFVESSATVKCSHFLVAGNTSEALTSPDWDGVLTSLGYNLVGNTTGCTIVGDSTGNQLDVDPLFVDPLAGNYRPSLLSPVVDAGDPARARSGTDLDRNPRLLDGDLDRLMRHDLGAYEFDHVRLTVTGDASPGGTLTLDSSGTAGLSLFLFVGLASDDRRVRPFGSVFFSLSEPWRVFSIGTIPDSRQVTIPLQVPIGTLVILQDLAIDPPRSGNLSNAVSLIID